MMKYEGIVIGGPHEGEYHGSDTDTVRITEPGIFAQGIEETFKRHLYVWDPLQTEHCGPAGFWWHESIQDIDRLGYLGARLMTLGLASKELKYLKQEAMKQEAMINH